MSQADLDRVRADLAILKEACVEPALPSEDIGIGLVLGLFGLAIAISAGSAPRHWIVLGSAGSLAVASAVYIPWKMRIVRSDAPRRRMEIQETRIWTVVCITIVAYMVFQRFALTPVRAYGDACFFAVGLGVVANGADSSTRRYHLAVGIPAMIAALLLALHTQPRETFFRHRGLPGCGGVRQFGGTGVSHAAGTGRSWGPLISTVSTRPSTDRSASACSRRCNRRDARTSPP